MKYILAIILVVSLLFSCNSTTLLNNNITSYNIIKIEGLDTFSKNPTMTIDLAKKSVSGSTACNHYGATIVNAKNSIKFEGIMATKMYCVEFAKIENTFTRNLSLVTSYKIAKNKIIFFNKSDEILLIGEKVN